MHQSLVVSLRTRGQRNAQKLVKKFLFADANEVKSSKSPHRLIEKLLWLVVYVVGALMATLTCYNLLLDYRMNPMSLNIVQERKETITLPDATLCLPTYHIAEITYRSMNNISLKKFAELFFSECASWEEARNTSWPLPVLYLVQNYLDVIFKTESLREYQQQQQPLQQMLKKEDNESEAIADVLVPQMVTWNVTLTELIDVFAEKFRKFSPLALTMQTENTTLDEEETKRLDHIIQGLVFVTTYQVCYRISLTQISLSEESRVIILTNNRNLTSADDPVFSSETDYSNYSLPDNDTSENSPATYWYIQSLQPLTIDFSGEIRPGDTARERNYAYIADYMLYTRLTIKLSTKHLLMCAAQMTNAQCQAECRSKTIKKLCNCSTSAIPSIEHTNDNFTSITGCPIGQYEHCLLNFTGSEDAECSSQCQDCVQFSFDVYKEQRSMMFSGFWPFFYFTAIELCVSAQSNLIFEQYSEWSIESVYGGIGGAFGLWTGLDIFVIVNAVLSSVVLYLTDKVYAHFHANEVKYQDQSSATKIEENPKNSKAVLLFATLKSKGDWNMLQCIKWLVKNLIWLILFFLGASFTIKLFVGILEDFRQGGTKINLKVMYNKSMFLPPSAFCVPMYGYGNKYPLTTDYPLYFNETYDMIIKRLDVKMFPQIRSNESWETSELSMAFYYVMISNSYFRRKVGLFYKGDPINGILVTIRAGMNKWSVTENEMQQKVGREFVRYFNITIACSSTTANTITQLEPYFFSFETAPPHRRCYEGDVLCPDTVACVHFPLDKFAFHNVNDYCSFSAVTIPNELQPYFWAIKPVSSYDLRIDVKMNPLHVGDISFSYTKIYQFNNDYCSLLYASPSICIETCRQEAIEDVETACGNYSETNETIAWMDYLDCWKDMVHEWTEKCNSKCLLPSCTQAQYEIRDLQDNREAAGEYDDDKLTKMKIRFRGFSYPQFSEQLKMTTEEFIASAGGVLGLWISLNIVLLINATIAPVSYLLNRYAKSSSNKSEIQQKQTDDQGRSRSFVSFLKFMGVNGDSRQSRQCLAKFLLEKLFWNGVYLALAIVACRFCIELYQQSVTTPVKSTVEFMPNDSFMVPFAILCFPFMESEFSDHPDKNYKPFYHRITKLNISENVLRDTSSNWTDMPMLFPIVHYYLTLLDSYKTMEKNDLKTTWSLFSGSANTSSNMKEALDFLSFKMQQLNVTDDQLKQKFGQELLQLYKAEIVKYQRINGSSNSTLIRIERIAFVSETRVCYALPSNTIAFYSSDDYISVQADISQLPNSTCPFDDDIEQYDNYKIMLGLLESQTDSDYSKLAVIGAFGQKDRSEMALKVTDVIRILPVINGVRYCSETVTRDACMEDCRNSAIERECNCILPHANNKSKRQVCSYEHFKRCLPHFTVSMVSNCSWSCLSACERIQYSTELRTLYSGFDLWGQCKADIIISAVSFQYMIYTEKFAWTNLNLLAALGGIVDLWLGIDAIWFIEGCLAVINWILLKGHCTRPRVSNKENISSEQTRKNNPTECEVQSIS